MATVRRQTPTQLAFIEALDALLREQNHPFVIPSAMLVINSIEVRTENKQVLGAGVEEQQGGVYHYNLAFTLHVPKPKVQRELPEGYDADATAEEVVGELDSAEHWAVDERKLVLEMTPTPGWAYCPLCNTRSEWAAGSPNCPSDGLCRGRGVLPIPTTLCLTASL